MVKGASKNINFNCPDYVAHEIAKRGKSVARVALFLLKRVYDRVVLNNNTVNRKLLDKWFTDMDIDGDGLDNADRAYINSLTDKPVGIQYLTAITGLDKITLEESIEPFLLTHGYVKRTPRGRVLGDRKIIGVWSAEST
jgi:Holliday junction DNA helicase RuvB